MSPEEDFGGGPHGYFRESVTLPDGRLLAHDQENVDSGEVEDGVPIFIPAGRERWTLDEAEISQSEYQRLLDEAVASLPRPDMN